MDTVGQLVEYCWICMPKKLAGMAMPLDVPPPVPPPEGLTVTVAVALALVRLVAVKKVEVVAAGGETDLEVPMTAPLLMERVGVGLPDTDQERVEDWPEVMEEGAAVKDEMTGAAVAADTLTVIV